MRVRKWVFFISLGLGFCFSQFVAHPICQQVLSSIWCGNLAGWRGSRTAWKLLVSVGIFLSMPFLCLVYWIAPKSKVMSQQCAPVVDSGDTRISSPGQPNSSGVARFLQVGKILKIPVIKFLLHSASYLWFLITLLGESITMEMYRDQFASRKQSMLHSSFHMVWVVGGFHSGSLFVKEESERCRDFAFTPAPCLR